MYDRENLRPEHRRNIYLRPDPKLYLRPDPKLYLRHDAHRFLPPQADELKYSPNQPRVPIGNPGGGQWTHEGGDSGSDARVVLASDQRPEVPKERPPTAQERNKIARGIAREGPGTLAHVIAFGAIWLKEYIALNLAASDSPKSLAELQQAVSDPRPGYDIHHIVERATAATDGSEDHLIDAPDNLVRIPRWKHWELNSWYETSNEDYGGLTPRAYARGKSWEVRDLVGQKGLIAVGVLKR